MPDSLKVSREDHLEDNRLSQDHISNLQLSCNRKQYLTRRLDKVVVPVIQTGLVPEQGVFETLVAVASQMRVQKVNVVVEIDSFGVLLYARPKLDILERLLEF